MTKPLLLCWLLFLSTLPTKSQNSTDKFEFSPKTAHPTAKALMKEDFFWSPIDESGPFGSDGGSDAAYGYLTWRKTNASISPMAYLKDLINSWHYPDIPWDELDTAKIAGYIKIPLAVSPLEIARQADLLKQANREFQTAPGAKQLTDSQIYQILNSSGIHMGLNYLVDLDEAIIGTAFAQIVLEGKIDPKLKYYVTKVLEREMLPILTRQFGRSDQQLAHNEKMKKLLQVVRKMPS